MSIAVSPILPIDLELQNAISNADTCLVYVEKDYAHIICYKDVNSQGSRKRPFINSPIVNGRFEYTRTFKAVNTKGKSFMFHVNNRNIDTIKRILTKGHELVIEVGNNDHSREFGVTCLWVDELFFRVQSPKTYARHLMCYNASDKPIERKEQRYCYHWAAYGRKDGFLTYENIEEMQERYKLDNPVDTYTNV